MGDWLNTPLIVLVVVATLTILYKVAQWQQAVDSDLASIRDCMNEIRADIKRIFDRLP